MNCVWTSLAVALCLYVGFTSAIIGGKDSHRGEFPHFVQLQVSPANRTVCGGAIVSELTKQFVVTSAACAAELRADQNGVRVVAGQVDRNNVTGIEQFRSATKFVLHPEYNAESFANDIAIIGLDAPFNNTGVVRPIRLPFQGQNTTGFFMVAGFGGDQETEAGRADATVLQKLQIPAIADEVCALYYSNSTFTPTASNVCVMSRSGTNAHCAADRGGPAMSVNYRHLSGVISYPSACTGAQPGMPDVYTEVSNYVTWIHMVAVLL